MYKLQYNKNMEQTGFLNFEKRSKNNDIRAFLVINEILMTKPSGEILKMMSFSEIILV